MAQWIQEDLSSHLQHLCKKPCMAKCAHNPSTMELGLALGSLRDLSPETTWRITVQEARCPLASVCVQVHTTPPHTELWEKGECVVSALFRVCLCMYVRVRVYVCTGDGIQDLAHARQVFYL